MYRRIKQQFLKTAQDIEQLGSESLFIKSDVSNKEDVNKVIKTVIEK